MIGGFLNALHASYLVWRSGRKISLGRNSVVERLAVISARQGGFARFGARTKIKRGAMIQTYGGNITIGDDCTVQSYAMIYGGGPVVIGNGVRIASHAVIVASSHDMEDTSTPIFRQGTSRKGITIEDDVWIGANVTVTDGSHIAKGCVIGAGAVVRGRTEPYGIYAGVPARLIRYRGQPISAATSGLAARNAVSFSSGDGSGAGSTSGISGAVNASPS